MPATKPRDEPDFGEPDFMVRIVTCRQEQDGPGSSRPVHESVVIKSEELWRLLREKNAYVIAAHIE